MQKKGQGSVWKRQKFGIETIIEKILYNPQFRKDWKKRMENGFYYYRIKPTVRILSLLFPTHLERYKLNFIANSHLDAAWLWIQPDTIKRAYMTFKKAIEYIETYPYFIFTQTSPQYYLWMKQYDPELWSKIKKYVAEGRLELAGGMWVEPDLNVPCGESLVRQRLYGMLFYLLNFGKMPKVESLLDVFGFPQQIPQIFVKSGTNDFWTTKCTWNEFNKWPFANYWWEAQDGSRVFTHHFKIHLLTLLQSDFYGKMARFPKPEYIGKSFTSFNTNKEIENSFSTEVYRRLGVFYGWGDGAKGPLEVEIGAAQLAAQLKMGKFCRMDTYFELLKKELNNRLIVWADEMYLEYHRGCLTTQVQTKKLHRLSEYSLIAAESIVTLLNLGIKSPSKAKSLPKDSLLYNKAAFFEAWRKLLFNEFHDILPGSSIQDVYVIANRELQEVVDFSNRIIGNCLRLAHKTLANDSKITVFNPSSFARSESLMMSQTNTRSAWFEQIPPLSFLTIEKSQVKQENSGLFKDLGEFIELSNNKLRASIRKADGALISLIYLKNNRDVIKHTGRGAGIRVFVDKPKKYHAWNLDMNHLLKPVKVEFRSCKIENDKVVVEHQFRNSDSLIEYVLLEHENQLRVRIKLNMRNKEIVVKYFVPVDFQNKNVYTDSAYGTAKRSRVPESEMQLAKFEFPMHKWVDISDNDFGVSIFSKDRYGASANHLGMAVTLVRTPKHPTSKWYPTTQLIRWKDRRKHTDMGFHVFDLAIYPHEKAWNHSDVHQKAEQFNVPIFVNDFQPSSFITDLPEPEVHRMMENVRKLQKPFATVNIDNVTITSIKPAEMPYEILSEHEDYEFDGKTIIVRAVEWLGKDSACEISFNPEFKIKNIHEADLLERKITKIPMSNQKISIKFGHNEIKTLLIEFE